jgi:methionyl-tRNA synthetase
MKLTMLSVAFLAGSASLRMANAFSTSIPRTTAFRAGAASAATSAASKISFSTSQQVVTGRQQITRCFSTSVQAEATKTPATTVDDGLSPFQITTPIYYVNDKPHIGHAYTSLACDVIARFMRLSGREVFFLSGTDEHGQKVEESANKKGDSPQDFVDEVSQSFRELLKTLNISNDKFIRTTDEDHKKAVQHLWKTLVDNGAIYLGSYEGWYSVRDECYYTESELVDGKAPTGSEVIWQEKEPSYFFKLSAFEDKLLEYFDTNPDFIAPSSRRNEVLSFVKGGLRDLSVSRTSFKWGVPVPGDDDHVMYVWIDALANYISAIGYPDDKENFDKFWPANVHIVGKDILRFHAVYWPAFLMAADIPVPKRLFAHGWWTKDGEKISKSLGNVIDPNELVEKYGVDQTRFFLMSEVTFGSDGDFSHERMIQRVNTNLANEFGNLVQRTLSMVFKNCDKAVPLESEIGPYTPEDEALLEKAKLLREEAGKHIASQSIHKYAEAMISMIWESNKYIDNQAPWILRKTDTDRMKTVLYVLLEVLRYSAILYQPLIPTSANKILDLLIVPEDERTFDHLTDDYKVRYGAEISKPEGVFPRLELPEESVVA